MTDINFRAAGQFKGISGGPEVLENPTTLQFGPDGRLYVSEQGGMINAFTVVLRNGRYVATDVEEIDLVQQIQNHNDDGSLSALTNRQVTGLLVSGTATAPVLYVSSSDPRIAFGNERNADTNSGVITRLTLEDGEWSAVDIVRGLPRSEQSHATNGLALSPDGRNLYVAQGGSTNNGAPSALFSYANEYALSGTVLEIDLRVIDRLPVLTDAAGGQRGRARQYVYDLPTLDDPTVRNGGNRENNRGLDVAGPWGGNDGFNMSILPADAPLRIFADGFRNHYDLVMREDGRLYTVDNGSNDDNGGDPVRDANGRATSAPNDGGTGDPEPLFLVRRNGYYGHPNPARSNQQLTWTVYKTGGEPDDSLSPNTVPNLSALVPEDVNIQTGFLIDPSKFTARANRLSLSGRRIQRDSDRTNAITTIGSSSNGLVQYSGDAFDGALTGALLVAQFNGNVTLLNVNEAGTALEPLIAPGADGQLGTADDVTIDEDGIYPLLSGFSTALDVTEGPNGSIWVAEVGGDFIKAFTPAELLQVANTDFDNDGLENAVDPFIRDETNGQSVTLRSGESLLWDFDPNQDNNLPGPNGYGGGLTGVMVNGRDDFEAFFRQSSSLPGQDINLDNVKFLTAAGGGTTVIEQVSRGNPWRSSKNGKYLFHTGVSIDPAVDVFTVKWSTFNPSDSLVGPTQEIGGYIGTGDQSNYLKLVATKARTGEVQFLLEDGDEIISRDNLQADDLFLAPAGSKIFYELTIDRPAQIAIPRITYETLEGGRAGSSTVQGPAIDISGTQILEAIEGRYQVQGQTTGLAVGLLASNNGQPDSNTFQAAFDDIEVIAEGAPVQPVLYRVNVGGNAIAATDSGPDWAADSWRTPSEFLVNAGTDRTYKRAKTVMDVSGLPTDVAVPETVFRSMRWDGERDTAGDMQWAFEVEAGRDVEVRLYLSENYLDLRDADGSGDASGDRVFSIQVDDLLPGSFSNLDPYALAGNQFNTASVVTHRLTSDGRIDLRLLNSSDRAAINGIEIVEIDPLLQGGEMSRSQSDQTLAGKAATQSAAEISASQVISLGSMQAASMADTSIGAEFLGAATLELNGQQNMSLEPDIPAF